MKINRLSLTAMLALAVGTLLACSNVVIAQDTKEAPAAKKRGFSPDQQLERLSTELNLTDAQKPKVKELLESGQKKRQELRGLAQDERREKGRAIMDEQNKKMKEILTPDQFEKYQKMADRRRQRGQGAAAPAPKTDADKKAE
jgi:Spy/CpxP family protein refolding chaperone